MSATSLTRADVVAWLDSCTARELVQVKRALERAWRLRNGQPEPPRDFGTTGEIFHRKPWLLPPGERESMYLFQVWLIAVPQAQRIACLREIRAITNLDLVLAKRLLDTIPKPVALHLGRDEADDIKQRLEAVSGVVVEIRS